MQPLYAHTILQQRTVGSTARLCVCVSCDCGCCKLMTLVLLVAAAAAVVAAAVAAQPLAVSQTHPV
jgi:hypothetical protein